MTLRSSTRGTPGRNGRMSREPLAGRGGSQAIPATGTALAGELGRSAAPSSLARGVGLAVTEESGRPRPRLTRALRAPRRFERFGSELRRHQILELELLLGREREKLVGRLLRRERTFGALAFGDDLAERLGIVRSEEHTSELQSLMRTSYAVFCLKKKT